MEFPPLMPREAQPSLALVKPLENIPSGEELIPRPQKKQRNQDSELYRDPDKQKGLKNEDPKKTNVKITSKISKPLENHDVS